MTDIVERLGRYGNLEPCLGADIAAAKAEIERLRADNQQYRTALLGICRPVWSTPPIDSEAASVYARVCKEMIDIAQFAIAWPTHHNAPGQADANPSQCPRAENE